LRRNFFTSFFKILAPGPVPFILLISILAFLAYFRATGEAFISPVNIFSDLLLLLSSFVTDTFLSLLFSFYSTSSFSLSISIFSPILPITPKGVKIGALLREHIFLINSSYGYFYLIDNFFCLYFEQ